MKTFLLDTHILLWWLSNDSKITRKMIIAIENPDNRVLISSISIWEIIIKKSLHKLEAPENLKEAIQESNFELLPMTIDHALYVEHLPKIHHDPFDRLLIAQSIIENAVLITADKIIPHYKVTCHF